jgi:hypothetical protein
MRGESIGTADAIARGHQSAAIGRINFSFRCFMAISNALIAETKRLDGFARMAA